MACDTALSAKFNKLLEINPLLLPKRFPELLFFGFFNHRLIIEIGALSVCHLDSRFRLRSVISYQDCQFVCAKWNHPDVTLPWFHVHQIGDTFLMNGGQYGKER